MPVEKVVDVSKEDKRQQRLIVALFAVGILGFSYLIYDYLQIVNRTSLPQKLDEVSAVVQEWKAEGFVYSFDVAKSELVVDEEKWGEKRRDEKVGIVTQLARYCASANKSKTWQVRVIGNRTSAFLGGIGQSGLVIQ